MLRAAALPRVRSLPRSPRGLVWVVALAALLVAGLVWFRDSSLVRVRQVTVTGISGPEAPRIQAQLSDAARDMTTLHVDEGQLRAVVEPYPVVRSIDVEPDFPHGLRVIVHERTPVAIVEDGDTRTPVAADGTLLRGAAPRELPAVPLRAPAGGDRVTDRQARRAIAALAAAPDALRERVTEASHDRDDGLVLDLAEGPDLRFGTGDRLAAKWSAAMAVLADESAAGAAYIDVRYPERPAAGGLEDPADQLSADQANAATPPAEPGATTATPAPAPTQP